MNQRLSLSLLLTHRHYPTCYSIILLVYEGILSVRLSNAREEFTQVSIEMLRYQTLRVVLHSYQVIVRQPDITKLKLMQ